MNYEWRVNSENSSNSVAIFSYIVQIFTKFWTWFNHPKSKDQQGTKERAKTDWIQNWITHVSHVEIRMQQHCSKLKDLQFSFFMLVYFHVEEPLNNAWESNAWYPDGILLIPSVYILISRMKRWIQSHFSSIFFTPQFDGKGGGPTLEMVQARPAVATVWVSFNSTSAGVANWKSIMQ
jgi:hypothetical protein